MVWIFIWRLWSSCSRLLMCIRAEQTYEKVWDKISYWHLPHLNLTKIKWPPKRDVEYLCEQHNQKGRATRVVFQGYVCIVQVDFSQKKIYICINYHIPQADCSRLTPPSQALQQKQSSPLLFGLPILYAFTEMARMLACLWTTPVQHTAIHNSSEGVKPFLDSF